MYYKLFLKSIEKSLLENFFDRAGEKATLCDRFKVTFLDLSSSISMKWCPNCHCYPKKRGLLWCAGTDDEQRVKNAFTCMTRSASAFPRVHDKGVTVTTRWHERLVNIFPVRGFIRTLIPLFAHVEMLAMCHFSWRRTKSMMNSGLPSKSKSEEKSLNKTETTKERKTKLLENICNSPKHQSPCKPRQLWECVTVGDRPRLRKCRKSGSIQATTTPTTRPTPSSAPTSPVKMCVCMKPRPGSQGDMSPYNGEKTSCNFSEMILSLFLGPFAPHPLH